MGVKNENILVTADPVYTVRPGTRDEGALALSARYVPADRPLVGVSVRFAAGMETNTAEFAAFCDRVSERAAVVFIDMQCPEDEQAAAAVRALMKNPSWEISAPYEPQTMMDMLECMDAVVSTRLHSIIFAACVGTPVLGVVYDPKVEACLRSLGMPSAGTLDGFDAGRAAHSLFDVLSRRGEYAETLRAAAERLRNAAEENERQLALLLGCGEEEECRF